MSAEKKQPIRVLIADDSYFMRKVLTEMLEDSEGAIQVVDCAQNGWEAVEKNKALNPDVITLDVEMPKLDGLSALQRIMLEHPTPVVMVSSHTAKGTEAAVRALEIGAVDCVAKPSGRLMGNIRAVQGELVEKIKVAALCRIRQRSGPQAAVRENAEEKAPAKPAEPSKPQPEKPALFVVAVASSTGGPRALNELFTRLKKNTGVAFVVVQHISTGFSKALARRLSDVSQVTVSEAEKGNVLLEGHAYVAPGGVHLVLEGGPGCYRIDFNDLPPRLGVKPSADLMMASVAKMAGNQCAGVVLTGMGRDGTAGMKEIRKAGGKTFAQDEKSCVVYGMPKSAVEAGVVDQQLVLSRMAEEINQLAPRRKES